MIEIRDFFIAKEHNIKSILTTDNRLLTVPNYQRNFAWTEVELTQFWNDFISTYNNAYYTDFTTKLNPKPHFFGTVLLTETENDVFEITDGQQRLTVSTIFLKTLLEVSAQLTNQTEKSGIASMILPLIQRNDYDEPFQQRLSIDSTVNEFFSNYILNAQGQVNRDEYLRLNPIKEQNPPSSAQKLKVAYDFFKTRLLEEFPEQLSQLDLHEKLKCFISVFIRLFTLLEIRVKNRETAYTIFGTINNRGKDLTDSDIIKNEIFKLVENNKRHVIKEKWDSIIDNIDSEDLTDYLRFQYASVNGPVKKVELFKVISEMLKTTDPVNYLDQLKVESEWYARVTLLDAPYWNQNITEKLQAFKNLDVSHSIPLLLTGSVLYNNNEYSFNRLVNSTLVFCLRFFTAGKNSVDNLEKEIGKISKSLRKREWDLDYAIAYMKSLTSDQEFRNNFFKFSTKSSSLAFYLLNELERKRMSGVIPLPHGPSQHIEHIMPKKPSQARGRENEWSHVRDSLEYKDYVYRIGNQIILESEINQKLSNKEFTEKKTLYLTSGLSYPKEISNHNIQWDFTTIEERQTNLAIEALEIWKY